MTRELVFSLLIAVIAILECLSLPTMEISKEEYSIAPAPRISNQTCQPRLPLPFVSSSSGANICLFNRTGNLAMDAIATIGNTIVAIQNSGALLLGNCYCRQDCTPSQVVCQDPGIIQALFPSMEIFNGFIQLIYAGEKWYFYCYCPSLVPQGTDPCAAPPNPSVCSP